MDGSYHSVTNQLSIYEIADEIIDEIPRPSASDNQSHPPPPPLPVKRKVMRMRKKKVGAQPPPPTRDTANHVLSHSPSASSPVVAAPKVEEMSPVSGGEVEESAKNRTADEKRCKVNSFNHENMKMVTEISNANDPFSPLALHHRELQERPVHVRHRKQRHLLQLVRLQQARRHRLRLLRLRIRRLLPL